MLTTDSPRYTTTAMVLHWLIAVSILVMLALGWGFDYALTQEIKFAMIQLHKSLGITILLLSLARLGWRLSHRAPALPKQVPLWEQRAAHVGHVLLYIGMIGVPLSGWAMVSASTRHIPTILYGFIPWPHIPMLTNLANQKEVAHQLNYLHGLAATLLAFLVAGHIAAALKHHFIDRDDVLLRMLPQHWANGFNRLRGKP